jgi:hypothetical protein
VHAIENTTGEHVRSAILLVNRMKVERTGTDGFTDTEWALFAVYAVNTKLIVAATMLASVVKAMMVSKLVEFTPEQRAVLEERWKVGMDALDFAEGRTR